MDNLETSSEGEATDIDSSDDSTDSMLSVEEIDEGQEVALDLTNHSHMAVPSAVLRQTVSHVCPGTSASADPPSSHGLATTQSQYQLEENDTYCTYLMDKFSNYSADTMNHVQFEISKVLFRADMGAYKNTGK